MCARVDKARSNHIVGGHRRFYLNLEVWNAREPGREKANGSLFG